MRKTRLAIGGFEDGRRGHPPRKVTNSLHLLSRKRNRTWFL